MKRINVEDLLARAQADKNEVDRHAREDVLARQAEQRSATDAADRRRSEERLFIRSQRQYGEILHGVRDPNLQQLLQVIFNQTERCDTAVTLKYPGIFSGSDKYKREEQKIRHVFRIQSEDPKLDERLGHQPVSGSIFCTLGGGEYVTGPNGNYNRQPNKVSITFYWSGNPDEDVVMGFWYGMRYQEQSHPESNDGGWYHVVEEYSDLNALYEGIASKIVAGGYIDGCRGEVVRR